MATVFLAGAFLATVFLAGAFLATVFVVVTFSTIGSVAAFTSVSTGVSTLAVETSFFGFAFDKDVCKIFLILSLFFLCLIRVVFFFLFIGILLKIVTAV